MRKQLFTAVFALAAIGGIARGEEESSTAPTFLLQYSAPASQAASPPSPASGDPSLLPPPAPASQAASPPPLVSAGSAPGSGGALGSGPGPNPGQPFANVNYICGPPRCFWVSGEYLMWWLKDSHVPALVTTGEPGATPLPGVLGQTGTNVLFGNSGLNNQMYSGARFSGGFWLNDSQTFGLMGSYFFLGTQSTNFSASSTGALGSAMIARPFFDVMSGIENAQLVAFPGLASGSIHVSSSTGLQGAQLNMLCCPCCKPCCDPCADQAFPCGNTGKYNPPCGGCHYWWRLLGGFSFLELNDGLGIAESTQVNPTLPAGSPLFGGSTINMNDQFNTYNYFYGGQIGSWSQLCWGRAFVDLMGTVGLGVTHSVVDIYGSTAITPPTGTTTVIPAGFLASGSNSGHFTQNRFAVLPQVGFNVGYMITNNFRVFVGYTFLYWSSVVRAGDVVDTGLSGTQIPTDTRYNPQTGPQRPAAAFQGTDFWAQGINFGLVYRY